MDRPHHGAQASENLQPAASESQECPLLKSRTFVQKRLPMLSPSPKPLRSGRGICSVIARYIAFKQGAKPANDAP